MKIQPIQSLLILVSLAMIACAQPEPQPKPLNPHQAELNQYWQSGKAEITSYKLEQARYGEVHKGTAVLLFVTEPFSPRDFVKSDEPDITDVTVMKTIHNRKFTTGIYPYSMVTSSFFPFKDGRHAYKVSSSSQEWCGHTYMELLNKDRYEVEIHSYFEGETAPRIVLEKTYLEDDMWAQVRLNPDKLPTGEIQMIPSFFFLRLKHKETKAYNCQASIEKKEKTATYTLLYTDLKRGVSITYETAFPFRILEWSETYPSGFGNNAELLTTKATRMESIKTDYWNKNAVKDSILRQQLKLN